MQTMDVLLRDWGMLKMLQIIQRSLEIKDKSLLERKVRPCSRSALSQCVHCPPLVWKIKKAEKYFLQTWVMNLQAVGPDVNFLDLNFVETQIKKFRWRLMWFFSKLKASPSHSRCQQKLAYICSFGGSLRSPQWSRNCQIWRLALQFMWKVKWKVHWWLVSNDKPNLEMIEKRRWRH